MFHCYLNLLTIMRKQASKNLIKACLNALLIKHNININEWLAWYKLSYDLIRALNFKLKNHFIKLKLLKISIIGIS